MPKKYCAREMHSKFKTIDSIFVKITSAIKHDMISIYVSGITKSFNREDVGITYLKKFRIIVPGKCFLPPGSKKSK